MNTTYILHGGGTRKGYALNSAFFSEFTKSVTNKDVKILMCYWARERNTWNDLLAEDIDSVNKETDKSTSFHIVTDANDLFSKIDEYDVLYVRGGDPDLIEPYYKELGNLKTKLKGKVYLGSSMGAFLVSTSYVLSLDSQDTSTVHKGLGILPINILCHWDVESQKQKKLDLLTDAAQGLPILTIDECQYSKFTF
jgi:peptidase E